MRERGKGGIRFPYGERSTSLATRDVNRESVWRENVESRANFSVGVIHQQLDTLGLNRYELANYYTIIIYKQTNKHI